MKLFKRLITAALIILLAAAAVFAVINRDYIVAFYYSKKYDTDTIAELIEENDKIYEEASKQLEDVEIRDLTHEEQEALENGTLTQEQAVQSIVSDKTESSKPSDGETSSQTQKKDYDKLIAQRVAQLYVLKSQYIGYLKSVEQNVINDYNALPESEKNSAGKRSVILKYYDYGQSLEKECDASVEKLLTELSGLLKEAGRDQALISSIRSAYNNEKTLQKSYYLSIYNG